MAGTIGETRGQDWSKLLTSSILIPDRQGPCRDFGRWVRCSHWFCRDVARCQPEHTLKNSPQFSLVCQSAQIRDSHPEKSCDLAQAIRRALLLGCSRRILSIYTCNSPAMFFLASSKLLPRTVTDRLLHSPFQPSSSDQKSQSIGMLAVTSRFTT